MTGQAAMSWEEWSRLDGLALADLARARQVRIAELTDQAAAGVERVSRLDAVVEVFDDARA
ncbi:MAG TPA: amidase, partial [Acetobacteraceae bacterium]|nr:amidase [Acetobacteraceae bacterium]